MDGRSLVVAGDDNTTLGAQEITLGLNFTAAAGPDGNFELFDGDRVAANWDVPFNDGSPAADPDAPQLILELFADPAGIGGSGPAILTWTPGAVPTPTEQGDFPVTNNDWNGVTFTHDPAALSGPNYQYALRVKPANPAVDKGWNAFKIRAAGTVLLLGNQVVGFLGAMNVGDGTPGNPGDLMTIYPNYPALTPTVYDGTWSFRTRLPAFLGDVTIFDGDMDFGDARCTYNDTDDPDSSGIPPFSTGAAVAEGVAQATGQFAACSSPGSGIRTGLPADDQGAPGSPSAFRRIPSIVPAGIAYRLVAPASPSYPGGQVFLNQNPSGNKEWEQFKIELVDPGDAPLGPCPAGGYPADAGKGYEASDCRTDELPGGVWEVQLDGMDMANLNFWFFGFKVEPIVTEYSIGRLVWLDSNSNGVQDGLEPGIAGVSYTVYDGPLPGASIVRTGVTDGNGEFFEGEPGDPLGPMPAADYTVVVDASNFDPGGPLNGLTSTTGGEEQAGIEVGQPLCTDTNVPSGCGQPLYAEALFGYVGLANAPYFIVIDEDSIDNGIGPNNFSAEDVNDQIAKIGQRRVLPRFDGAFIGTEVILFTGQTMDEGWFSVPTIPQSWADAGPNFTDGLRNFVGLPVGPGLGKGKNPEKLLEKIPDVTPWTAPMLFASVGATFCAVVYDSDVSVNYNPLNGSLKGANLGIVAFQVLEVRNRGSASSSSLPKVRILILNANDVCAGALNNQLPPLS